MTRLPLTAWQMRAARLCDAPANEDAFTLPGADALGRFAALWGGEDAPQPEAQEAAVPFRLPGAIPQDVEGPVSLCREIDFGALDGDRALLLIDHLMGEGDVLLSERVLARFGGGAVQAACAAQTAAPCLLALDVTDALHAGRRETLTLRFGDARPAGACGPVFLLTTARAHLDRAGVEPDAAHRTLFLGVRVCAQAAGRYALRARVVPDDAAQSAPPAREVRLSLCAGEARDVHVTMEADIPTFSPGSGGAAAVQIELLGEDGARCDGALLLCGYPDREAHAFLPLSPAACAGDPHALADRLRALCVPAVAPGAPVPDCLLRALCRAGIAVRLYLPEGSPQRAPLARYPHVRCDAHPLPDVPRTREDAVWQLCGAVASPRALDGTMTPDERLREAAGMPLDPADAHVSRVLDWLCAVSARLRAEAARQRRFSGALCAADAVQNPDVADALRTAFAPLHLSALPLQGAWWTRTRFSARIEAFLPADEHRPLEADAVLEDEDGAALAHLHAPCRGGGYVGILEAALPDHPCALTLRCRLSCGGATVKQTQLPIYVGERGPLEAAFL